MRNPSTQNNKHSRARLWLLLVPLVAVFLWLVGVGLFRQPAARQVATASTSQPPATLLSAADYLQQGDYEFDRGNIEQALLNYGRAIELDATFANAYNNRAYVYMSQQDYAKALADLNVALTLRPDYVNALMNRGDIYNYYYNIDYDKAVQDYDRVQAIDPAARTRTSVCGHRLLAVHHGWSMGVFGELLTHGTNAGCTDSPLP